MNSPLYERVRPKNIEDYIGQQHLVGKKGMLTFNIERGIIPSLILWGNSGTGKTTLAKIIANSSGNPFYTISAINSGVKDIRDIIDKSKKRDFASSKNSILFIDEIHRFSKSQQDSLLNAIEKGYIILIGATTENPSFEVIPPLLSRCHVYTLNPLDDNELIAVLNRAIEKDAIISKKKIHLKEINALLRISGGDARRLLNTFELIVDNQNEITITDELVLNKVQSNITYDKNGANHYDIISAFIKSIRGGDPNAAVYWLARMIEGGEDVKFIARRLIILASEDIGNSNPTALILANNTFQSVSVVGLPESRIILSQCVIYLSNSVKSNSSYTAIEKAQRLVRETGNLPVPLHLRNSPTEIMKNLKYGKGYKYSHDYENNFINQEFFPEEISKTQLYNPGDNQRENQTREVLKNRWKKYKY
ncbi:replication-associated recombination protein A [Ichthyobacterium seriolicida]|uniref:Replication-associated recombination protein A n=1 Tax=Ichthyobacterium seriolicida TaxID=242600 RepID=A0A1J1E5Z7_9FLAO|nr:replication-associated recombination protein A [Ichthyobacterium seriolicida]BAV94750.1 ATPase AAA [Ichthyobacterium seriolicida]